MLRVRPHPQRFTEMFAFKPRLFHKGLILLSVPLIFEAIVGTSLICLQYYYCESVKAEALRAEVIYRIRELYLWNMHSATDGIFQHSVTRNRGLEEAFSKQYLLLTQLLKGEPQQLESLEHFMRLHQDIHIRRNTLENSLSNLGHHPKRSLLRFFDAGQKLSSATNQGGEFIRPLTEYERTQSAKAAETVRFVSLLIQAVLAVMIFGSAVIAYVLFRYFMRGIHGGVHALIQNIHRFKAGESVAPPLEGSDELALLDRQFHDMAGEVANAQKMKQAFISTVSTELRIPISKTRDNLTQLAAGALGSLSEEAKDKAERSKVSLDRLLTLLNDLLALQAHGRSQLEVAPRMCALSSIIHTSIDTVSALAEKNNVRLEAQATDIKAYADADRIVQVLVNLLSNAIKFSPAGSSVVISVEPISDQVEIRVKDSGRGVPAHLRDSIFERFQQVTATDATEKGGTGLGLPICKQIVELHGGKIGVLSEEGKGSTFWFRLPAVRQEKSEQPADISDSAAAIQPKPGLFRMAPKTILAKGLILISVPLLVELAFGSALFAMQRYYQDNLNKERVAVDILFHANEMGINCDELFWLTRHFIRYGGEEQPIELKIKSLNDEYSALQKLIALDSAPGSQLNHVRSQLDVVLKLFSRLRADVLDQPELEKTLARRSNDRIFSEARGRLDSVRDEISTIEKPHFLDKDAIATEVNSASARVITLVLASLAASTLVAILLFKYFIRSINTNVKIMVENTDRFRQGLELLPPLGDGDELTKVDAAFHEMADEIRDAQMTKQAIVSMISHDLRSPLTAVSGYFYLLTLGALGEATPEAIAVAEKSQRDIDQLIRLITDLLDLDKIEAGMLALQPRMVQVKQVMERAISQVTSLAAETAVSMNAVDTTAEIYADHDRIIQALSNLLLSAVKLSPVGSSIDASAVQRNGGVEIRVTSPGASTSGEQLTSQFDRYQKREHGLSLELPVSKEIVRLHGGTIGATSEQRGCALWICLPVAAPSAQPA